MKDESYDFPDEYFDLQRLAAYSKICVSSLRLHIKAHGLPAYQPFGKILIQRSEFDKWVSRFKITDSLIESTLKKVNQGRKNRRI